jgi:hypothetical protein
MKNDDDLQLYCGLTGKRIEHNDYVVWFPSFIRNRNDPFWRYNEWPMLREAFDDWKHKDAFLARWGDYLFTNIVPRVSILVNRDSYLLWLAGPPSVIVIHFLAHGFSLDLQKSQWQAFGNLVLNDSPQHLRQLQLPNGWRVLVDTERGKNMIAWEPPLTLEEGRRDRIMLDSLEWEALKEVLQEASQRLGVTSCPK